MGSDPSARLFASGSAVPLTGTAVAVLIMALGIALQLWWLWLTGFGLAAVFVVVSWRMWKRRTSRPAGGR